MNCNKRKKKVRQNNSLDTKSRIVIKKKKKRQLDKKSRVDIKKKKYVYKILDIQKKKKNQRKMKSSVSERKKKNKRGGGLSTACVLT